MSEESKESIDIQNEICENKRVIRSMLEPKPEPGGLTNHLREQTQFIGEMLDGKHPGEVINWPEMLSQILEACDLIDRLTAENKKQADYLLAAYLNDEPGQAEIKRLNAIMFEHHICSECGKKLSDTEWRSVHTCYHYESKGDSKG